MKWKDRKVGPISISYKIERPPSRPFGSALAPPFVDKGFRDFKADAHRGFEITILVHQSHIR